MPDVVTALKRDRRPPYAVGLLEVLPSAAPRRPPLEPQARAQGVLRPAAEPAAAEQAAVPTRLRHPLVAPTRLNDTWALDFMSDALYDGRRFRPSTCSMRAIARRSPSSRDVDPERPCYSCPGRPYPDVWPPGPRARG